ncbi:MAG: hypothetical protein ACK5B9_00820 [Flavobacteriia bacterium]|jgi:hypothetical protein
MSKVKTLGASAPHTIEIEKPIAGFYIGIRVNRAYYSALSPFTITDSNEWAQSVLDFLNEQTATLTYKDRSGNATYLFNNLGLGKLAEYAQSEEGVIKCSAFDEDDDYIEIYLPLNEHGGAIAFNNDETLELLINTSTGVTSGQVNTIESPILAPSWFKYGKLNVEQNQTEKQFDVTNYEKIMIPLSAMTSTCTLTIIYSNGSVVRMNNEELKAIGFTTNDICVQFHGLSTGGFVDHAILDVSTAKEIQFHRASTTAFECIYVDNILVDNLANVKEVNSALYDTTQAKLMQSLDKKM